MNTKQDILAILEAHQGESISGERIAKELHITRSAVWKGIQALKEEGCPITAGTNRDIFWQQTVISSLLAASPHA